MSDIKSGDTGLDDIGLDEERGKFAAEPDDGIKPIDVGVTPVSEKKVSSAPPLPDNLDDIPTMGGAEFKDKPEERNVDFQPVDQPEITADRFEELQAEHIPTERNLVSPGDYIDLLEIDPVLRDVHIGAGWEQRNMEASKLDLDLSCFLLDKNSQTRQNEDFVYYNNEGACDGAIRHTGDNRTGAGEGDDESFFLDLNGIPFDIVRLMFVISIYDEDIEGKHFGMVRDLFIRLVNKEDGNELARLVIPDEVVDSHNGLRAFCMVREGSKWFLDVPCEAVIGGLGKISKDYGMIIAEDTG